MKQVIRWGSALAVASLVITLSTQTAQAKRLRVHEFAESPAYKQKAGGMIGRGVLNGVTFFVDPVVQTVEGTQNGPAIIGTLAGFGGGLGCGALRLGSGVVDVVTFWIPGFNGLPVSDSYSNCLEFNNSGASSSDYSTPNTSEAPSYNTSAPAETSYEMPAATTPAQPAAPEQKWTK